MSEMKYRNNLIFMEGLIKEVYSGSVEIELNGRLGRLRLAKRMVISDYEIVVGQKVGFSMSYPEVIID